MIYEWDERKRAANINERDVDFAHAVQIFENMVLTRIDDRKDYGEIRLISLGMVEDECFVVVHTERKGATRIITAWKGGQDEKDQYHKGFSERHQ